MEIQYGSKVVDRNGKLLGKVDHVIRDTYTGETKQIRVGMGKAVADIFFAPQDIIKATPEMITVDITRDKPQLTEIQYGVSVEDSQGKLLGTVDFIARDTVTGESRKFKVSKGKPGTEIFFAPEDILDATIDKVILRTTFDKLS